MAKINTLHVSLICFKHWRLSLWSKITATQSLKHFTTFARTLQDINQKIQKNWLYSCMLLLSLCQVNGVEFYVSTVSEACKCNRKCRRRCFFSFFSRWTEAIAGNRSAFACSIKCARCRFLISSHTWVVFPDPVSPDIKTTWTKKNRFNKTTTKLTNKDYRYMCIEWCWLDPPLTNGCSALLKTHLQHMNGVCDLWL